jgi:gluconate 5-dehydrogenase
MAQSFSLDGRVALVAGASRGLGLAIAEALGAAGAAVILNARDGAALEAARAPLAAAGIDAAAAPFDITDAAAVQDAVARIEAERGRLDILVDAVGMRRRAPIEALSLEDFRAMAEVNLTAAFGLAKAALPALAKGGKGRILFVTSIAGPIARAGDAAYTASKGGLAALVRALAVEAGPRGVTANAIAPGFFNTKANLSLVSDPEVQAYVARRCPLGRWGEPNEVGGAAVFLASDAGSYVNGHVLTVDGGLSASF